MDDYVGTPARLCIWHVVNGAPFCFVVEPWAIASDEVDAIIAANVTARTLMSDVLALAATRRLIGAEEPPPMIDQVDPETGAVAQVENPDHIVWAAAPGLVAAADPEVTRQLALRAGEDVELDELPANPYSDLQPVPYAITARQARVALAQAGIMAEIDAHIATLDAVEQEAVNRATVWVRDSAFILAASAELDPPLSVTEINALFRFADQID